MLAENFFSIFLPALELARKRHVRLSSLTTCNRFAIASGLISIFIFQTPEIFNIIQILTATTE
jgi:hypothetical protein